MGCFALLSHGSLQNLIHTARSVGVAAVLDAQPEPGAQGALPAGGPSAPSPGTDH